MGLIRNYYNMQVCTHSANSLSAYRCKNIFTKMLKDVGIEVPNSRETRPECSLLVFTDVGIWGYAC